MASKEPSQRRARKRRVKPHEPPAETIARAKAVWAEMDELSQRIGAQWPAGVSAAEAVTEQRR